MLCTTATSTFNTIRTLPMVVVRFFSGGVAIRFYGLRHVFVHTGPWRHVDTVAATGVIASRRREAPRLYESIVKGVPGGAESAMYHCLVL